MILDLLLSYDGKKTHGDTPVHQYLYRSKATWHTMAKPKKQQSLLDSMLHSRPLGEGFSLQRETIDLTEDITQDTDQDESVVCPICLCNMAPWEMDMRIRHVEECLSVLSIRELESETLKIEEKKSDMVEQVKAEKDNVPNDARTLKKRKVELGGPQKERLRYVNKEPPKKRDPPLKPTLDADQPKDLLVSSRKTPIPELKVLTFRPTSSTKYEISVDAFCYKPHELITQYFLSHFHSDHYGGITKRWCSERTVDSKIVYCTVITGRLLTIRFKVDPEFIFPLEINKRYKVHSYDDLIENGGHESTEKEPGLYVTLIEANHCPGAAIFLFESVAISGESTYQLHCGDFRVNRAMIEHPDLLPFHVGAGLKLEKVYLDTTYMSPKYNFPKQEDVCGALADMFADLTSQDALFATWFGTSLQSRITDFLLAKKSKKKKFLILVGTYLIGKEKLAISILKRLNNCPIYVSNINSRGDKVDIVRAYKDAYLEQVLTENDLGDDSDCCAVVHLVPMKIVGTAAEMSNYFNFNQYFHHYERCVGLRPTGWTFDGKNEDTNAEDEVPEVETGDVPLVTTLNVLKNVPPYSYLEVLRQKPPKAAKKTDMATLRMYSLPYSEHLSFRELSYFVVFLNIGHVIPTVNTTDEWSRARMESIISQWESVRAIRQNAAHSLPQGVANMIKDLSLEDF